MAIWGRSKTTKPETPSDPAAEPRPQARPAPSISSKKEEVFRLGEAMRLKGELIASTDVEIQGQVEGTIRLDGYRLRVTESAEVMADISARIVQVTGQVVGNVTATEQIRIGSGGCVLGDLCAPSIQLEDGSQFTGGINRQAAPAKVTGQLNGDGVWNSPRSDIESSVQRARRKGLFDQHGSAE